MEKVTTAKTFRKSAFDHPLAKFSGSFQNSADRVTLCPEGKLCEACKARAARRTQEKA